MPFDSRDYRRKLGFTNQTTLKKYFKATDTRTQMEGQRVFSIPDEAFRWFLPEEPPHYIDILF